MVFYNFYEIKEIGRSTNFSFYYFHETNEIVEALGGPSSIVMPNFENFDHDPQLDIKFWNLTSNFETHKNIGENFDYIYRFMYTLSMYR